MTKIEPANNKKFAKNGVIVICQWSGRLGNNLIQPSNAIFLCLRYQCRLQYPEHKFILQRKFDFSESQSTAYYISRFYDPADCQRQMPTLVERRFIMLQYVRELLTFDLDRQILPDNRDRLVLQIRSGDSFNNRPNPRYVPSPISFFRKIIKDYAGKEIVIVCEDRKNRAYW